MTSSSIKIIDQPTVIILKQKITKPKLVFRHLLMTLQNLWNFQEEYTTQMSVKELRIKSTWRKWSIYAKKLDINMK